MLTWSSKVSPSPILDKQAKQVRDIRGKKNVKRTCDRIKDLHQTQYLALSDVVVLYEKIILSSHAHDI